MSKNKSGGDHEDNVPIWIQFLLSATIVTSITYLARNVSYKYASILYSLPYTFLILFTIYTINKFKIDRIRKFAFNVILALFNISMYSLTFTILEKYTNVGVVPALFLSFITWTIISIIIYYEPYIGYVNKYILKPESDNE